MKELTTYNRVAGYLNKVFDMLNTEFFENALSRPTITIQSTPRAYGHFSLREDLVPSKFSVFFPKILVTPVSLARTIPPLKDFISSSELLK